MKDSKWTRLGCLGLVLCLLVALLPGMAIPANAADENSEEFFDFVLMVDCSNTMSANDPKGLARDACKMFVDLIPIENARVSVIAFGYQGDAYQYTSYTKKAGSDDQYVHELTPFGGKIDMSRKTEIKSAIDGLSMTAGQKTPIGSALAAGTDVLLKNGSTDGNACLILMTDGEVTSTELKQNEDFTTQAIDSAKQHRWPIYCIEMDYLDVNERPNSNSRKLLNRIVTESGAGESGRMKVNSPAEVAEAFMQIFTFFWKSNTKVISQPIDANGVVQIEFEIPKLTSEATIAISGNSVDHVELYNQTTGYSASFKEMVEEKNLFVTKEDSYMSVKMICPDAGNWVVKAFGDPYAEIVWYQGIQMEMNLAMAATPSSDAELLTKNDSIAVKAQYTYNDNYISDDDIYLTTPAELVVTGEDGLPITFPMEATEQGYVYNLPVVEIPTGTFKLEVKVKSDMFRNGEAVSNSATFQSENLPVIYHEDAVVDLHAYINAQTERIDLATIFENPDGDQVSYDMACTSDRNVSFDFNVDENNYLVINSGMVPGTFTLELTAVDPDMETPLTHPITLTVEDRPITAGQIEDQEVWSDYYDGPIVKQDPTNTELNINLDEYFSDPDGVALTYSDLSWSGEAGEIAAELNGNSIHITPLSEGDLIVTFKVSDGVSTISSEFAVEVVSGRAVYRHTYGIFWLIGAAIVLAIIIIICLLLANKHLKGTWDIGCSIDSREPELFEGIDIANNISGCRKHKFSLESMLREMQPYFPESGEYFDQFFTEEDFTKIQLGGVIGKRGCVIMNLPKNANGAVQISLNGNQVTRKTKMTYGQMEITVSNEDGSNIVISMHLN